MSQVTCHNRTKTDGWTHTDPTAPATQMVDLAPANHLSPIP